MSRSLTTTTNTEVSKTITKPHTLVKISYPSPLYYCSSGDLTWNSITWVSQDFKVSQFSPDNGTGTLTIGDVSGVFGALYLQYGIADIPIKIWLLYGDGPWSSGDEELLFDGIGDSSSWIPGKTLSIKLLPVSSFNMFAPWYTICKNLGFNHLPVEGQIVHWEDEVYTLGRDDG